MKNVSFTAGPKNGQFVNARMSHMHHSSESRTGFAEVLFASIIVMALLAFALVVAQ